jgi:hypothetical protein
MRILLDTHIALWAVTASRRLSRKAGARSLGEITAGWQPCEDDLHLLHRLLWVQAEGDAMAVVVDAGRADGMQLQANALGRCRHRLVGGVVDHHLHDVQRDGGAGVHAPSLHDGPETLQHANRGFGVGVCLLAMAADCR